MKLIIAAITALGLFAGASGVATAANSYHSHMPLSYCDGRDGQTVASTFYLRVGTFHVLETFTAHATYCDVFVRSTN